MAIGVDIDPQWKGDWVFDYCAAKTWPAPGSRGATRPKPERARHAARAARRNAAAAAHG